MSSIFGPLVRALEPEREGAHLVAYHQQQHTFHMGPHRHINSQRISRTSGATNCNAYGFNLLLMSQHVKYVMWCMRVHLVQVSRR